MNDDLLEIINRTEAATSLYNKKGYFVVNDTIGISLLFAGLFKRKPGKYLLVASNLYNAQSVAGMLASLIGDKNVLIFPFDDLLRNDYLTSSKELLSQRLFVLNESLNEENKIIICHTTSLLFPLPNICEFKQNIFNIKVGDILNIESLKEKLVNIGYTQVNKIDQSLQFASRGDIFDIFSINLEKPIRIEFFDNQVETIQYFDIATQTSIEKIDNITIIPANDCLFTKLELDEFREKINKQIEKDSEFLTQENAKFLQENADIDYERIISKLYHPRVYKYYQYIKHSTSSIIDYFQPELTFIINEKQFDTTEEFVRKECLNFFAELNKNGKIISHLEMYKKREDVLKFAKCILRGSLFSQTGDEIVFDTRPLIFSKSNIPNIKNIIDSYLSTSDKVIIALSNRQQFETIQSLLEQEKQKFEVVDGLSIPKKKLAITMFSLNEGFELAKEKIAFITSKELFGFQNKSTRFLSKYKEATILRNYEDLRPGDYVVHEYYGIGQFLCIETIEIDGVHRDFLQIQYEGTDKLFIPLNQFRLVRKYSAREGAVPKLSSLSNKDWEKTKSKIKERVNLLADRLFRLYSERSQIKGFVFQKDDEIQRDFENEFPYELTPDQQISIKAIKEDMESDKVMDRLLCGDVGFGKTEVAFRAIFKAILSGKQAAILCPTTLLARQHYELALERFRNFGVNIAIFSRLIPSSKQRVYIKGIKEGKIHLIIGTHRLLSNQIEFNDLGLLVVDEEQRFGVEQKEKIKEMKANLDVLSLSATPIPRTLQLSLVGVRPVSQINTAPLNRTSIQTYVAPHSDAVIKELIERELSRKGQVFYIHNVVYSIHQVAAKIQRSIPNARIGVVHGKMEKNDIEDVMLNFYNGDIDVLVATSIIENGIDVPNANLIIVEDADHFGLSQLYQIKGRVGRGDRLAYAYLFYRPEKDLSDVATKRLKAIQDFAELGSGYKIAQRDLMIRGAGDILGSEQAGFIDSVGLDLYLKLLNEVIEEKKTGKPVEPPKHAKLFNIDAYIPNDYAGKEDKIELYQEIENCKDNEALSALKKKIRDVYGRLPSEVELLINKKRIDLILEKEEFNDINEYGDFIEIVLSKNFSNINGIGAKLFDCLSPYISKISVTYFNKELKIRLKKDGNWLLDLETIIKVIDVLYEKEKKENDEN